MARCTLAAVEIFFRQAGIRGRYRRRASISFGNETGRATRARPADQRGAKHSTPPSGQHNLAQGAKPPDVDLGLAGGGGARYAPNLSSASSKPRFYASCGGIVGP